MIWAGFIFGLLGSLHCIGMCGPVMVAVPFGSNKSLKMLFSRLAYQFGRATSYLFLGLVFGLLGTVISLVVYQQYIMIVAGAFIVAYVLAVYMFKFKKIMPAALGSITFKIQGLFGKFWQQKAPFSRYLMGIVNGFIPCGLVYLAAISSLAGGSVFFSMGYMLLFALGTFPVMFALSMSSGFLPASFKVKINKWVPYLAILVGCLFILKGLALGIPFISPAIEVQAGVVESCCATGTTVDISGRCEIETVKTK